MTGMFTRMGPFAHTGLLTRFRARARRVCARAAYRAGGGESGRAIIEFIFLGVLFLVPLVYLIGTLAQVQGAAYAVTSAAREAGRAYTTADTEAAALARARAAARVSLADFGHTTEESGAEVIVTCDGAPCLRAEGRVQVTVRLTVHLPLVPDLFTGALPTEIPVSATHVSTVDRFGGR